MMKWVRLNLLIAVGLVLLLSSPAQGQYVKALGGTNGESGISVIQTSDGGFVVGGMTESFGEGDRDDLLTKFDLFGNHLWTTTVGYGDNEGGIASVIEASDGGLVVFGWSESFWADREHCIAKFDGSGNHLWTRTIRGAYAYWAYAGPVIETSDGGLFVIGATNSFVGGAYQNIFLSKLDSTGSHLWTKTLGGSSTDLEGGGIETSDGGLVVSGHTKSFGAGDYDLILAKLDSTGSLLWTKTLGGSGGDYGESVIEASDGGLVVAGYTESFGAGDRDLILAKFDSTGVLLWTRTLGGSGEDGGYSITETSDGGLVVSGWTKSFGTGDSDLLLAKFDASGNHLWTWTLGGTNEDRGRSLIQASDGGFVVTGYTESFGAGGRDLLLARFDSDGNTCLGEFVTPEVQSVSPDTTTPSPTVISHSPTITSPDPTITSPTPTSTLVCNLWIISITDVGNDQGKQVRVKWHGCSYDSEGSPVTITEYSLWRRIGEDKSNSQSNEMWLSDAEMLDAPWLYPPGDWDFIKTVPAIGEVEYNTVCPTLGDSTLAEGMYWSVFFVIAHTDEPLIHYDSDPDSGYSVDNIPPLPILDLEIDPDSWFTLHWTVPGEYEEEQPISSYDIRYSTEPVGPDTQAWWDNAQACTGEGFFNLTVGEKDSFRVAGETGCHPELYFAVKGLDDRSNASGVSNVVHFLCGDDNGDGIVNVGDVVYEVCYLFRNGPAPSPKAAGDVNCDGIENVGDIVYKVSYLYKSGPPPCGL